MGRSMDGPGAGPVTRVANFDTLGRDDLKMQPAADMTDMTHDYARA